MVPFGALAAMTTCNSGMAQTLSAWFLCFQASECISISSNNLLGAQLIERAGHPRRIGGCRYAAPRLAGGGDPRYYSSHRATQLFYRSHCFGHGLRVPGLLRAWGCP